ncbi:MAG: glycosyltransferase family 87 protein [Candidatus Velamenicoccus archaeovorus]
MQPTTASTSRTVAVFSSVASVLLVGVVASVPGSPLQPVLPGSAGPFGPFRWGAEVVGLDRLGPGALAGLGLFAMASAAAGFLLVLREAWRGHVRPGTVLWLAVAYHAALFLLPLLFSRDVYSYASYGRIAGVHHANPYVATPSDFPNDPLAPFIGPRWVDTPAVYGPLFTLVSSWLVRLTSSVAGAIWTFRTLAVAASLATLAVVARVSRRAWPDRRAFAIAAYGLNPVVLFQSAASGHNDLLVALAVVGALALVHARRDVWATAALSLGALVKATAVLPLVLLLVAVTARAEPGRRIRTLAAHAGVAVALALVFAAPFLNASDPSLGMVELAGHEGWLAPSRLFRRVLAAVSGDVLGVVARLAFALLVVGAVALIVRWTARRGAAVTPLEQGGAWAWTLLLLMLLGPVLLPWYVTWALPLAWLLPPVPRTVLLGTGVALTLSQWTAEPARFARAYDLNVLFGHYVLTPVVVVLLGWVLIDLRRRLRADAALQDQPDGVSARAGER